MLTVTMINPRLRKTETRFFGETSNLSLPEVVKVEECFTTASRWESREFFENWAEYKQTRPCFEQLVNARIKTQKEFGFRVIGIRI